MKTKSNIKNKILIAVLCVSLLGTIILSLCINKPKNTSADVLSPTEKSSCTSSLSEINEELYMDYTITFMTLNLSLNVYVYCIYPNEVDIFFENIHSSLKIGTPGTYSNTVNLSELFNLNEYEGYGFYINISEGMGTVNQYNDDVLYWSNPDSILLRVNNKNTYLKYEISKNEIVRCFYEDSLLQSVPLGYHYVLCEDVVEEAFEIDTNLKLKGIIFLSAFEIAFQNYLKSTSLYTYYSSIVVLEQFYIRNKWNNKYGGSDMLFNAYLVGTTLYDYYYGDADRFEQNGISQDYKSKVYYSDITQKYYIYTISEENILKALNNEIEMYVNYAYAEARELYLYLTVNFVLDDLDLTNSVDTSFYKSELIPIKYSYLASSGYVQFEFDMYYYCKSILKDHNYSENPDDYTKIYYLLFNVETQEGLRCVDINDNARVSGYMESLLQPYNIPDILYFRADTSPNDFRATLIFTKYHENFVDNAGDNPFEKDPNDGSTFWDRTKDSVTNVWNDFKTFFVNSWDNVVKWLQIIVGVILVIIIISFVYKFIKWYKKKRSKKTKSKEVSNEKKQKQ